MTKQADISKKFLKLTKDYVVEKGETSLYPEPKGKIDLVQPATKEVVQVSYATYVPESGSSVPYVTVSIKNQFGNMTTSQIDGPPADEIIDKIKDWMLDSQLEALK